MKADENETLERGHRVLSRLLENGMELIETIRRGRRSSCPEERARAEALEQRITLMAALVYSTPEPPRRPGKPAGEPGLLEELESIFARSDQTPVEQWAALARLMARRQLGTN